MTNQIKLRLITMQRVRQSATSPDVPSGVRAHESARTGATGISLVPALAYQMQVSGRPKGSNILHPLTLVCTCTQLSSAHLRTSTQVCTTTHGEERKMGAEEEEDPGVLGPGAEEEAACEKAASTSADNWPRNILKYMSLTSDTDGLYCKPSC